MPMNTTNLKLFLPCMETRNSAKAAKTSGVGNKGPRAAPKRKVANTADVRPSVVEAKPRQ